MLGTYICVYRFSIFVTKFTIPLARKWTGTPQFQRVQLKCSTIESIGVRVTISVFNQLFYFSQSQSRWSTGLLDLRAVSEVPISKGQQSHQSPKVHFMFSSQIQTIGLQVRREVYFVFMIHHHLSCYRILYSYGLEIVDE